MKTKTDEYIIGEWVIYCDRGLRQELGRVKSFNATYVFVVFNCDCNWNNYTDYTAQACYPTKLEAVPEIKLK